MILLLGSLGLFINKINGLIKKSNIRIRICLNRKLKLDFSFKKLLIKYCLISKKENKKKMIFNKQNKESCRNGLHNKKKLRKCIH